MKLFQLIVKNLRKLIPAFVVLYLVFILCILFAACFIVWTTYQSTVVARSFVTQKYNYWKTIASKYPNYPDAHFEVAILSDELGNTQLAIDEVNKALQLDPTFIQAKKLKQEIE